MQYFRDAEGQDVLLFVDNIFRFTQAGAEVSALLGRIPSAVGYQPTLATDMGMLQVSPSVRNVRALEGRACALCLNRLDSFFWCFAVGVETFLFESWPFDFFGTSSWTWIAGLVPSNVFLQECAMAKMVLPEYYSGGFHADTRVARTLRSLPNTYNTS